MRALSFLPLIVVAACGGSKDAAGPLVESYSSGRACAVASGSCDGGHCAVDLDNRCDSPVTCKLKISSVCQSSNGDTGPATATSDKATQLAGVKRTLEASVDCGQGSPRLTKVEAVECF
jgi:hypothetical protein